MRRRAGSRSLHSLSGWSLVSFIVILVACTAPVAPTLPSSPVFSTATPFPIPSPAPASATAVSDLHLTPADVVLYPGPALYSGDVVTFDITPHGLGEIPPQEIAVRIYRQTPDGAEAIAEGGVGFPAFDGIPRARLTWAWDTTGLERREALTIWLDPDDRIRQGDEDPTNNIASLTVRLLPAVERPPLEAAAAWTTTYLPCCRLHYLTDTAAERDLSTVVAMVEGAVEHVQDQLDVHPARPLEVYLIGRVIGHGGYVQQALALSYLDRQYAGRDVQTVVRHEATHLLDGELGGGRVPALVEEGLAVWVAGGHFKPEPIPERAAALVELGRYIPLERLADDFYRQQHEVAYLEAAALVAYLVEAYGREGLMRFYTSFEADGGDRAADALSAALEDAFGVDLAKVEQGLLEWLERHPPSPDQVRDLEMTIYLFDTIRRYQQRFDPGAYFLSGWLPDPMVAESRGIVADFLRHPTGAEGIALETMLISAQEMLRAGAFGRAEDLLNAVNGVLDDGTFTAPLAADYRAIVQAVGAAGYEAQRIVLEGDVAHVWAIADWPNITQLWLERTATGWEITR